MSQDLVRDDHLYDTLLLVAFSAPLVFTKVLKPHLRWARQQGSRISAYLDDLTATKELSQKHTAMVLQKLTSLGFLTKDSKSSLTPSQILQHLWYEINTTIATD